MEVDGTGEMEGKMIKRVRPSVAQRNAGVRGFGARRARVSVCKLGRACVQMQVLRTSGGTFGSSINCRNVSLIKRAHLIQL